MPTTYNCKELAGDTNAPRTLRSMADVNARLRRSVATIDLSSQALGVGDIVNLPKRPKGSRYAGHKITASVSLGTTTFSLGSPAVPAKYRALATFTAVETPTWIGLAAQMAAVALTADESQILTVAAAAAPGAGFLIIELFYTDD